MNSVRETAELDLMIINSNLTLIYRQNDATIAVCIAIEMVICYFCKKMLEFFKAVRRQPQRSEELHDMSLSPNSVHSFLVIVS